MHIPIFNDDQNLIGINNSNDELFYFKLGELLATIHLFNIKELEYLDIGTINTDPVFIRKHEIEQNIIYSKSNKASKIARIILNNSTYEFKFLKLFDKANNFSISNNLLYIKNGFKIMYMIIGSNKSSIEMLLKETYDEIKCYNTIQNLNYFTMKDLNRQLYFIDVLLNRNYLLESYQGEL